MSPFQKTIFASAFGELPPALSLFIDGCAVKSNAAFQYAAKTGITLAQAQRFLCETVQKTDWAQGWEPMPDGMLVTRVREDWIRKTAKQYPGPDSGTGFASPDEPYFCQKSILMRIASARAACGESPNMGEESKALFLGVLFDEREKETGRFILKAQQVLDLLQEKGDGPDRALLAAAGILQRRIPDMKEEEQII